MLGRIPLGQLLLEIGCHRVEVFLDALVHLVALDDQLAEIVVEDVAHHADRDVRLALQQLRPLAVPELLALGVDALPLADQALQILDDRLLLGTFGRGADNHAHVLRRDLRDNALEARTLALAQLAAHAGHAAGRHEHQKTPGERDLRSQASALVADRILGDLHEHRIARFERQLDAARLPFEAGRVPVHLTGIQHAVAGLADVDERRLHARQHVLHTAEVDVADRGDLLDVGDVMLDEHVVLDDGDLRVMAAFAHHHETVHVLAAREEVLLDQLALAAALAAVVAAALLLRLQSGGALDVGDLVDVLLLARAAHGHLIVTLLVGRAGAATATATGDVGVIVFFLVACAAG